MIRWIIISLFAFTVGNIIWPYLGQYGEPKFFYIPLSVFILLMVYELKKKYDAAGQKIKLCIDCFLWLAWGNVIKQVFYIDDPAVYIKGYKMPVWKLLNDFAWGVFCIGRLIYKLWVIRKQHSGTNSK